MVSILLMGGINAFYIIMQVLYLSLTFSKDLTKKYNLIFILFMDERLLLSTVGMSFFFFVNILPEGKTALNNLWSNYIYLGNWLSLRFNVYGEQFLLSVRVYLWVYNRRLSEGKRFNEKRS